MSAALMSPMASAECSVSYVSSNALIRSALRREGWTFPRYDEVCRALQSGGAALQIEGHAAVLKGHTYAWATVGLSDTDVPIMTFAFSGTAMRQSDQTSDDAIPALLVQTINDAIGEIDFK